jgi:hypothetical protein
MLSRRHSIGHRPPVEPLARDSKSIPNVRCYACPPPTTISAPTELFSYFLALAVQPFRDPTFPLQPYRVCRFNLVWVQDVTLEAKHTQ